MVCPLVKRDRDCDRTFSPTSIINPPLGIDVIAARAMHSIKIIHAQLYIDGLPLGSLDILRMEVWVSDDVQQGLEVLKWFLVTHGPVSFTKKEWGLIGVWTKVCIIRCCLHILKKIWSIIKGIWLSLSITKVRELNELFWVIERRWCREVLSKEPECIDGGAEVWWNLPCSWMIHSRWWWATFAGTMEMMIWFDVYCWIRQICWGRGALC